jgi:addiction module RelE/StbE family toxin
MRQLKIIWTPQSQEDLREIRNFIARDAPITAEAFVRRLRMAVGRLRSFPESGAVVAECKNPKIREIIHGAYRIIYRVRPGQIDILTVFHSARVFDQWQ